MMIPTIPTPDELLDKGFSRGKKQADLMRTQKIPKHLKGKRIEERRVITSCQVIKDKLKSIGLKKVALNLSEIDDDESITIDYSKGAFEYQLPYTIDIENTKNQLKDKSISSDSKKILIENQEIHENGLIKGSNFKSKEECLDKFMELLPDIRRNV